MHISAKSLEDRLDRVRALEDRLTFRLSILSRLLDQQASGLLEGTQLNLTGYRILDVVDTLGEVSISDISRFCMVDRAQISRTSVALERLALVRFLDDPDSKRKKLVQLTDDGLGKLAELRPRFIARNRELDELLGAERRADLIESINLLTEHAAS
ncbi:MAG: MarR family transcriptional regulator [Pseudomonadota bacterium]